MFAHLARRPMELWELYSAFASQPEVLRDVLSRPAWREPWLRWYEERGSPDGGPAPDTPVPLELSREVARAFDGTFWFDPASRNLRADPYKSNEDSVLREMSAVEVHDAFGGAFIEEIYEKGSAIVPRDVSAAFLEKDSR